MTNPQTNPYASAPITSVPSSDLDRSSAGMPGALKAVAIILIILGVLGLLGTMIGILGMVVQWLVPQPTGEEAEMQRQINAAVSGYSVFQYLVMAVNAIVSVAFVAGGSLLLKGRAIAKTFVQYGVILGVVCELARAVLTYLTITASHPIIESLAARQSDLDAETFKTIMTVSLISSAIFGGVWILIKIPLYVWFVKTTTSSASKAYLQG